MTTANPGTPLATDGVHFIYKHNTGRTLFCLFKKVSNPGCSNPNKHFNKISAAYTVKWNRCFTCDCTCKQCFTCTRGANKQSTSRDLSTQLLEPFRVFQKVDHFFQFFFCFFTSGHILKRNPGLIGCPECRTAFPEFKYSTNTASSSLHSFDHEEPETQKENPGKHIEKIPSPIDRFLFEGII